MIPIGIPSIWFYLLPLLSLLAIIVLVVWGAGLLFSPRWRQALRRRPKRSLLAFVPLALLTGFGLWFGHSLWQFEQELARQDAARFLTLSETRELGGITMPAGTRLRLDRGHEPETFVEADFGQTVEVMGLQALRVTRRVEDEYDSKSYERLGSHATTMVVYGKGGQPWDGWLCDSTEGISFEFRHEVPVFDQCRLAAGNDNPLAVAGAVLRVSTGLTYIDGHVDPDRWTIRTGDDRAVPLGGMWLSNAVVRLDGLRAFYAVDEATLLCPFTLGQMSYPRGTRVKTAARGFKGERPWVFTPPAMGDAGAHQSVVQKRSGELVVVKASKDLGVLHWDSFGVEQPELAACPRF